MIRFCLCVSTSRRSFPAALPCLSVVASFCLVVCFPCFVDAVMDLLLTDRRGRVASRRQAGSDRIGSRWGQTKPDWTDRSCIDQTTVTLSSTTCGTYNNRFCLIDTATRTCLCTTYIDATYCRLCYALEDAYGCM
jgi:hypothetical protein